MTQHDAYMQAIVDEDEKLKRQKKSRGIVVCSNHDLL